MIRANLNFVPECSMVGVWLDFSCRLSSLLVGSIPDRVVLGLDGEDPAFPNGHVTHQLDAEIGANPFA
jgi:hypothetical protein